MKRNTFIFILLLFIPIKTYAVHDVIDSRCTNSVKISLRNEAKEIVYRISKNDSGLYNIYFYNVTDDISIINDKTNKNELAINNIKPGEKVNISIEASSNTYCDGFKISSKTIAVPIYNKYYGTDLCVGYENLDLCSENTITSLSEEKFKEELIKRKKELEHEIIIDNDKIIKKDNSMIELINKYKYVAIYCGFIVLLCLIIYKIIKHKSNKDIL